MSPIIDSIGLVKGFGWGSLAIGDFESIASVSITTQGQSNGMYFTNIPSTYKHLQIRGLVRNGYAGTNDPLYMRINDNTSSSLYASHRLRADGGSVMAETTSATYMHMGQTVAANGTTSCVSIFVFDILDYSNLNKHKTVRGLNGYDGNGTGQVNVVSGVYMVANTSVTTIALDGITTGALLGSHAELYGIRA